MDSKSRSGLSVVIRARLAQQHRSRRIKRRDRQLRFESLEDRRLLAVDWRNPVNSLDVSGDGFISPLDALQPINELNDNGSHALADQRPARQAVLGRQRRSVHFAAGCVASHQCVEPQSDGAVCAARGGADCHRAERHDHGWPDLGDAAPIACRSRRTSIRPTYWPAATICSLSIWSIRNSRVKRCSTAARRAPRCSRCPIREPSSSQAASAGTGKLSRSTCRN